MCRSAYLNRILVLSRLLGWVLRAYQGRDRPKIRLIFPVLQPSSAAISFCVLCSEPLSIIDKPSRGCFSPNNLPASFCFSLPCFRSISFRFWASSNFHPSVILRWITLRSPQNGVCMMTLQRKQDTKQRLCEILNMLLIALNRPDVRTI